MPRRGNNEGSIRQRPDGKWEAAVQIDGHRFWVRTKSQAEARRAIAELRSQHQAGTLRPPSKMTVAQHMEAWLAITATDLRPKTQLDYEYMSRTFIVPAFGNLRVQQLSAPIVARQFSEWRKNERASGKTLLNVFRFLHRSMAVARQWGIVGTNPLDGVEAPRATKYQVNLWSQDEARQLLATLTVPNWDSTLISLLIGTGARLGEILGARWDDVDCESGTFCVRRNIVVVRGCYVEGDPKTVAGFRTIRLPAFAAAALNEWRPIQHNERLAAGDGWHETGRIVTLADGASPKHRRAYDAFHAACQAAGIPSVRLHDLRHLNASLLLAAGLPLPAVSARLGHASTAVTAAIYSHALRGQDEAAAAAIDDSLGVRGARLW